MLPLLTLIVFPSLMAVAAASDVLTMTIANRVSVLLVVGYLALAAWAGVSGRDILVDHLTCGLAVLGLLFAFFAFGWIGGGDAKLASATALWLGWSHLADYGLVASLGGAVLTLAILLFRRVDLPHRIAARAWVARLHDRRNGVPYGVALAVAGLALYPQTQLWHLAGA